MILLIPIELMGCVFPVLFFHERRCGAQPHRGGVKQYFCRAGEGGTWAQGKHVCILCMALLVHPKHKLPTEDFEGLEVLANFERAVEKRYNDVGRPLTALSQEEIMRGYLSVVDKRVIPNLWAPRGDGFAHRRKCIDLTYADEVRVHNMFDPWRVP